MITTEEIEQRTAAVREKIAAAAAAAGRDPREIKLIAVTKTHPGEVVRKAIAAGLTLFGENRVRELQSKAAQLPKEACEWHMIGHLQRNKARDALKYAAWIHSIDSMRLLQRVDRVAADMDRTLNVLLEVNVSGEEAKYGPPPQETMPLLETALACKHIQCRGLMTMAPFGAPDDQLRRVFAALRELRDRLARETGADLPELSMGMTQDYEIAVQEGATMVRIGTAIFGERSA